MTDEFEDQSVQQAPTPAPVAAEKPPSGAPAAKSPRSPRRGGSRLAALSLALSALALAAAGYHWLEQQQQSLDHRAALASALQQADNQDQQLRELQRQLDQWRDQTLQRETTFNADIESLRNTLARQEQRLHALSTTDREDWLLAEAEYLMRLANQRLLMGKEIAGARVLLKAADDIMVELDDSGLFPVRKALAENRAALRAAGTLDVEGLYLQLEAAAQQGDQLTLFETKSFAAEPVEQAAPDNWQQRLGSGIKAAWEKLKNHIRITRRDDVYKPVLAPEYEAALRQNLRLSFEQAQLAALAGKQKLYRDSLQQARHWLSTYYTLDQTAAQALVATVKELEKAQVEVTLPDISSSLRALKTYLDTRHDIKPSVPASSPPPAEPVPPAPTNPPAEIEL